MANESPLLHLGLQRLFGTNEPPTGPEEHALNILLADRRARAAALAAQVGTLKTLLEQLTDEHTGTNEAIDGLSRLLAPVRRLPAEVLGEIFLWALKSYRVHGQKRTRAPWFLGQVCRSWRNVAISLPSLWAKVTVHNDYNNLADVRRRTHEIEEQLARSSGGTLSVLIFWSTQTEVPIYGIFPTCGTGGSPLRPVEALAKNHLPRLVKAKFQVHWARQIESDVFMHAPNLSRLLYMTHNDAVRVPWQQIQRCYLEGYMPNHVAALSMAQNLVELELNLDNEEGPVSVFATLPSLRHLDGNVEGMKSLVAPALETLYLGEAWNLDFVRDFLARSRCKLRALDIKQEAISEDEDAPATDMAMVVEILRCVPSLELLLLTTWDWPGEDEEYEYPRPAVEILFAAMQLTGSATDIVPNLSTFVYAIPEDPFQTETFLDMARSRASASIRMPKSWRSCLDVELSANVAWIGGQELRRLRTSNFPSR
ncbi:F-box domain-containing protein [Mycena chlorophos]|uniref:F-box domain-containing protein n=1 Tax=Mycena chlorophos TaxID=658473 RepID=A0A8H6S8J9_MYCCL|nr:F-box domain-containing protein [Mycena chlorophos]